MISDLDELLGSRYFLNAANERTCLHRGSAHLKVPGRLLVWNALLRRLNEINGGCEKILPVLG